LFCLKEGELSRGYKKRCKKDAASEIFPNEVWGFKSKEGGLQTEHFPTMKQILEKIHKKDYVGSEGWEDLGCLIYGGNRWGRLKIKEKKFPNPHNGGTRYGSALFWGEVVEFSVKKSRELY